MNAIVTGQTQQMIERDVTLSELGEELGQFKPYSSDLPISEVSGTRIVKCLYQVNKKTGGKIKGNSYVRIPTKHLTEETVTARINDLAPHLLTYLQAEEDKVIKEEHKKGGLRIYTEYLTIDKLLAILEEANEGSRLNKDKIEAWFTDNMQDNLALLICDKMGLSGDQGDITNEQENKVHLMVEAYKSKFVSLASPKTSLNEADRKAVVNVIVKCGADETVLGVRFIAKIEAMAAKNNEQLLDI